MAFDLEKDRLAREKLKEFAKMFYESPAQSCSYSFTFVDLGAPYCGEINVMEIHVSYRGGKPTQERADAMWKRIRQEE